MLPFRTLLPCDFAVPDSSPAQDGNGRASPLGRNERGCPTAFAGRCGPSLSIPVGLSGCALVVEQTHAPGAAFSTDLARRNQRCARHALCPALLVPARWDLPSDAMGNLGDSIAMKDIL